MSTIQLKSRDPRFTEFKKNEVIINTEEGSLFYKSRIGLHKITSTVTTTNTGALISSITSSKSTLPELLVDGFNEPLTLTNQTNPTPQSSSITIGPSNGLNFSNTTNELLQITTGNGILQLGSQNSSMCNFFTDRSKFYFDKKIMVDSGNISSYLNQDLVLSTNNFNNGGEGVDSSKIKLHSNQSLTTVFGDIETQANSTDSVGFDGGGNIRAGRDLIYDRYVIPADGESNGLIIKGTTSALEESYFKIEVVAGEVIATPLPSTFNPYTNGSYYSG